MRNNKSDKALYGIIAILAIAFLGIQYYRLADLHIYLDAAQDILKGKNIYAELYGNPKVFPYMGSPTLAFLISPLAKGNFMFAALFWKLLSIFFLVRIWKLLSLYFKGFNFSEVEQLRFLLLSFFSVSFLIYRNFHMVQFTLFLLYAILEGIHQIREGKHPFFGVLILGLGIITKILPVVVVPYLIFRGHWKSVLSLFVVIIILILMPAVFIGWEENLSLNQNWLLSISPLNDNNVFDVGTRTVHGIATLISTLTIDGIGNSHTMDIKRNIVDLHPDIVRSLIIGVKLFLIVGTLYFLKIKTIFTDRSKKLEQYWELSYILLITPLVFPQQRSYAFFFIFPALVYLIFGFLKNPNLRKMSILFLFGIGVLILNLDLLLGEFRKYYWHFKTLTYGVLIMGGLLFWMSPRKILNQDHNK